MYIHKENQYGLFLFSQETILSTMERHHADERETLAKLSQQQQEEGSGNEVRTKIKSMTAKQQNARIFELSVSFIILCKNTIELSFALLS